MNDGFIQFSGQVHILNPQISEFSLCGVAFDAASSENKPEWDFEDTNKRTVTCPECASIILGCRGVRVAKKLQSTN